MVLVIFCCLFVFLGMYIGNRYNLKNASISVVFGLFLINSVFNILPYSDSILSLNYHDSAYIYCFLGCVLGYVLMKIFECKYDQTDNISIFGFSLFNSFLLFVGKINFIFVLVNIFYYILIGLYIRNSKSWIYVFLGVLFGFFVSFINSFVIGYIFTIMFGFIISFVISVHELIFRNTDKKCLSGLVLGILVGLVGCLL